MDSYDTDDRVECTKELISVLDMQMYISVCRVYVNWKTCFGSAVDTGENEHTATKSDDSKHHESTRRTTGTGYSRFSTDWDLPNVCRLTETQMSGVRSLERRSVDRWKLPVRCRRSTS